MKVFTTILLFASPVCFLENAILEAFHLLIRLNLFTFLIEQVSEVLAWERLPDFVRLLAYGAGGLLVAWLEYTWLQTMRKGFADVF
ncbi:MAG: hypothetical protein Q4A06_10645 [Cardiobacteriaceae bacterium]|nr:hypothetical protein [Cardiobacteriaceae bacterium]